MTQYWQTPAEQWFEKLQSSSEGLSPAAADAALKRFGPNRVTQSPWAPWLRPLAKIVMNPLLLILLAATAVSAALGQTVEATIIVTIVVLSSTIEFVQAYRSTAAVEALRRSLATRVRVRRAGEEISIALESVVPGDLVCLAAGAVVPGDALLLESRGIHVNEAALTGESAAVAKEPATTTASSALQMGTSVISGTGLALVVATGKDTEFGRVATHLEDRQGPTAFERGLGEFSRLVLLTVLLLVAFVFVTNLVFERPALQALVFSVALAVGLTPEFLPMILSLSLSAAAVRLSRHRVIIRNLQAIENLGEMDVLASDKTGTLTEGRIVLERHVDPFGVENEDVLKWAAVNSSLESGLRSPMDDAILAHEHPAVEDYRKVDELPFDFTRRRVSVVVAGPEGRLLLCKGAPEELLRLCTTCRVDREQVPIDEERCRQTADRFHADGFRVLAVASRRLGVAEECDARLESEMCLEGFCAFLDPPRADARQVMDELRQRGVRIKVITGDNALLTQKVCRDVGLDADRLLTGSDIEVLDDTQLAARVEETVIFARTSPAQKSRIIASLQGRGHCVGYLGDGINDAPALRKADVGISVDSAVDVARESADVILVDRGLGAVLKGVLEGRRSFANVTKYVLMGTSSNFGNMLSMAAASLFLDFLPLLPAQVLLNTLLYDLAQLPIAGDNVDEELLIKPRHWDVGRIRRFMLVLGPISSLYDLATFGVLLSVFQANEQLFRSGWFVESLCTQVLVIFVIRTAGPAWRSRPSAALATTALVTVAAGGLLTYLPFASILGFRSMPVSFMLFVVVAATTYLGLVEWVKRTWLRTLDG